MTAEETEQMAALTNRANHAEVQALYWRETAEAARRELRVVEGRLEALRRWLEHDASQALHPARFQVAGHKVTLVAGDEIFTIQ